MFPLRRPVQLFLRLDPAPLWPVLGHLASLAVLLGTSWLLAGLLGAFVLPAAAPASSRNSEPQAAAALLVAAPLFSGTGTGTGVAAPQAEPASQLQLLGILASDRAEQARAIIHRDGEAKPLVVAIGDRIGEQFIVKRIAPRQVELLAGSTASRLELPAATAAAPSPPSSEN